jgi:ATP-dependent Lhr-like helicase
LTDGTSRGAIATWLAVETSMSALAAEQHASRTWPPARGPARRAAARDLLIAERFFDEGGGMQLVLHAPLGGRINRAWGLALRKRFCRGFDFELQAAATDDGIVISLGQPHSFPLATVFGFLPSAQAETVLVQALLDAPMFEIRWRWNATARWPCCAATAARRSRPTWCACARPIC